MELQKKTAACENADTAAIRETVEELSELSSGELININERSCDKKDEDTPEEVAPTKQNTSNHRDTEIFHALKVPRIKCWKPIQTQKGS